MCVTFDGKLSDRNEVKSHLQLCGRVHSPLQDSELSSSLLPKTKKFFHSPALRKTRTRGSSFSFLCVREVQFAEFISGNMKLVIAVELSVAKENS